MTTTSVAPARAVVAEAIGAGHHRSADLIAATGLPERTVRNALTSGKAAGIFQHDVEQGVWTLAPPVPPAPSVALEASSSPPGVPSAPQWLARWHRLFDADGLALAPLIVITPALETAAARVDLAAGRRATIADDIAATATERQALEVQHQALSQAGADDAELNAIDAALAPLNVRAGRRAASLPPAIRAHGAALLAFSSALRDALVAAADGHKARLAPTDEAWRQLTQRVQSLRTANTRPGTLHDLADAEQQRAALGQARQADVDALAVLDVAWWMLPMHVQEATRLATLPDSAVASWVTACEKMPEQVAELAQARQAGADTRKHAKRLAWTRGLPVEAGAA